MSETAREARLKDAPKSTQAAVTLEFHRRSFEANAGKALFPQRRAFRSADPRA